MVKSQALKRGSDRASSDAGVVPVYKLPPECLLVSVYAEDGEAYNIGALEIGLPSGWVICLGDNMPNPILVGSVRHITHGLREPQHDLREKRHGKQQQ